MSKVLEASCVAEVVTADGVPVPSATILSEGVAESDGILVLDEDKAFYLPKTSPDLKTTLEKLTDCLDKIGSALSALDGAGFLISATMGVPSPPVASSDIAQLATLKTELEALTENLK